MIPAPFGFLKGGVVVAPPPPAYLADGLSLTPLFVAGTQRFLSSYTGACMQGRLRNSGALSDLTMLTDGSPDPAALATLAGSGDVDVNALYNQAGGTNHATARADFSGLYRSNAFYKLVDNNQIATGGTNGGIAALNAFRAGSYGFSLPTAASTYQATVVGHSVNANTVLLALGTNDEVFAASANQVASNSIGSSTTANAPFIATVIVGGGTRQLFVNGTLAGSAASSDTITAGLGCALGAKLDNSTRWTGRFFGVFIWSGNSDADRQTFEGRLKTRLGIT